MKTALAFLACTCMLVAAAGCAGTEQRSEADPARSATSANPIASAEPAADPRPSRAEIRRARRERRERAVEGAVRDFYREIDLGDYEAAWARLTPSAQAELGGFEAWRSGYDFSVSTKVSNVTAVEARPTYAVVLFKLRSKDIDKCADTIVQRFTGRWQLVRVGAHWRAASISAEKIAGATPATDIQDCASKGEDWPGPSTGNTPDYKPPYDYALPDPTYPDYEYDYEYDYEDDDYDLGAPTTEDFGSGHGRVGLCEDGTLSDSIGRPGACSHHGGVAD